MASEQLLVFATLISQAAATWPEKKLEQLECCREWCRNICLKIGLGPATLCLADFWVAITCAQVKLCDLNPEDINESSMGVRAFQAPISDLSKMNAYEKVHYKTCLLVVEEMTSLLQPMEPDLICQVQSLAHKVGEAIAEEA